MKTKSIVSLILAVLMIAGSMAFSSSAVDIPQIKVESKTANVGDTVSLNVDFSGNPGINSYCLSISYDTTRLVLDSVTPNEDLGGQFVYTKKAVWINSSDTAYNGTFLTLHFTVLDTADLGDATVSVSYNAGDICNYNEEDVDFEIVDGCVTVVKSEECSHVWNDGVATKKANYKADGVMTYTCTKCLATKTEVIARLEPKKGDLSLDGRVTSADVTLLKKYNAAEYTLDAYQKRAADFNGDRRINSKDVLALKSYIAGE